MFKIYKRGNGKTWQISYKIGSKIVRKTTKTDLFCNVVLLYGKIHKDINARQQEDKTRQRMRDNHLLAERIMLGKEKPKTSIDGFDGFYLDTKSVPDTCNHDLGVVYVIKSGEKIKIGITQSPRSRLRMIENNIGESLDIIYLSRQCRNYMEIEQSVHLFFDDRRMLGEWFSVDFCYAVYHLQKAFPDAAIVCSRIDELHQYASHVVR